MFSIFCFAQNITSDCAKFRTGRFQYIDSSKVVTVKRTKHVQEELVIIQVPKRDHISAGLKIAFTI